MTIAARVHSIRTQKGVELSARELSELAGVSNAYVTLLEKGQFTSPSQAIVARLASVLGTTSDYLGSGIGAPPKAPVTLAAIAKSRKSQGKGPDPKAA